MGPGDVIADRFVIEKLAATGGMGAIYRAQDRDTGQLAAVKVVPVESPQAVERFAREARVLAELRHPGIVAYLAHGQTPEGALYLAMEWLDGEDLSARLASSDLSLAETVMIGRQAAAALALAHARGVVHRDVKPSNLFLVDFRAERTKLLDFGIARLAGAASLTTSGLRLGTPLYMAPEQARGERDIDARADVFGLGCVLYRCLCGQAPFVGASAQELLTLLASTEEAAPIRRLAPAVPAGLDALLGRMLRKDPAQRPADAAAVLRELAELDLTEAAPTRPPQLDATLSESSLECLVCVAAPDGAALRAAAAAHGGTVEPDGGRTWVAFAAGRALERATRAVRVALAAGAPAAVVMGLRREGLRERAAALATGARVHVDSTVAGLLGGQLEIAGDEVGLAVVPDAGAALAPGTVVAGRYRVVALVAHGGMGSVYRADDLRLGGMVALKTIRADRARGAGAIERFHREINLARKVTHPNVCRIFDVVGDEQPVLSMELLEGETLAERLRRAGPLSPAEALPIIEQVIAGLAAAHEAGIIHRDLKPQNVVLAGARAVVTDFGLARLLAAPDAAGDATATGNLAGTPAYLAPEQVQGGPIGRATDVYALGLLIYEMVTGRPAFAGESPFAVAVRRLTEDPTPPRRLAPDLDRRWEAAILGCLERDPAARFQRVDDVARALRAPRGRGRLVAGGAALALLAAGGWLLAAQRRHEPPLAVVVDAGEPAEPPLPTGPPEDRALEHYRRGEVAAAQQALEQAIVASPHGPHARVLLAMVLLEQDLVDRAAEELRLARQDAAALGPDDRDLLDGLEDLAANRQGSAADRLTALYARRPSLELAVAALQALTHEGRWASAEAMLHAASGLPGVDAGHPLVDYMHGLLLSRRGDFAGACDVFARAADEADRRRYSVLAAKSRTMVASAQLSLSAFGEVVEACDSSRKILAAAGERAALITTLDNLSYALYYRGEYGRAIRMLDEAIELGRQTGLRTFEPRLSRSINLFLSGKHAEARAMLDQLAGEPAADASVAMARAWEREHAGDAAGALRLLPAGARPGGEPRRNDCYLAIVRGKTLLRAGSVAEARRELDAGLDLAQSIRFAPLVAVARWLTAWTMLEAGNLAEAGPVAQQARDELDRMEMRDYQVQVRLLLARIAEARGQADEARALRADAKERAAASEDPTVRLAAELAAAPGRDALEGLLGQARAAGLEGAALDVELALGELELGEPATAAAGRERLARVAAAAHRLGDEPIVERAGLLLRR